MKFRFKFSKISLVTALALTGGAAVFAADDAVLDTIEVTSTSGGYN